MQCGQQESGGEPLADLALPRQVAQALAVLGRRGFESYIVGGCVRDTLRKKKPCDWDIATSALPEQIMESFPPPAKVVPVGLRHGTVTVVLEGFPIEITTFRVDGDYTDARRPDSVRFTASIREDLARRDFTVNAMAYREGTGLIDPFGGEADLRAGVLRCVGDPDTRFGEDALRIMRALRFLAQHGFTIEAGTRESLLRNREMLGRISAERIARELSRLLCGARVGDALRGFHPVFEVFMPELRPTVGLNQRNRYHRYDVFEHIVRVVENVHPVLEVRFAALLHDMGKPRCFTLDEDGVGHFYSHPQHSADCARDILGRLKYENRLKEAVIPLVLNHDVYIPPEEKAVRRWLSQLGERKLRLLLDLKRGDCIGQGTHPERLGQIDALERVLENVLQSGGCTSLKGLRIGGRDLLEMGVPKGPQIGRLLASLFEQVLDGECPNVREALLLAAKNLLKDPRQVF